VKASPLEKARAKLDAAERTAVASREYRDGVQKNLSSVQYQLEMTTKKGYGLYDEPNGVLCLQECQLEADMRHARALLYTAERVVAKARIAFIAAGGTL
jgi:signal transduction histidine kinase